MTNDPTIIRTTDEQGRDVVIQHRMYGTLDGELYEITCSGLAIPRCGHCDRALDRLGRCVAGCDTRF